MKTLSIETMYHSATLSECGTYRFTLTRTWNNRPKLLVVMFNPATADHQNNDRTVTRLCHIAAHNGFGGIVVVNAIPLRSSKPAAAVKMTRCAGSGDRRSRDALEKNVGVIVGHVAKAGAVLLAWGALGKRCSRWMCFVLKQIAEAQPDGVPLYCLAKTAGGHPMHPMARGRHKVPKDAALVPWSP